MVKYFNTPFWIQAVVNYQCQCHCEYCYSPIRDFKPTITSDLVNEILKLAYYSKQKAGIDFSKFESNMYNNKMPSYVVSFELTEPLLSYPQLREGIEKYIKETGVTDLSNATILSNGLALTQEMFDFFDSVNMTLMLSIDSKINHLRGYDPSHVLNIIKANPGKITIRTVIKDQEEKELEDFLEEMGQYAKDIITQTECRGSVEGPTQEERQKAEKVKEFFKKKSVKHIHEDPYLPKDVNPNFMHSPTLQVDSDGEMFIMSRFIPKVQIGFIQDDFAPDLFLNELQKVRTKEILQMVKQNIPKEQRPILISQFLGTSTLQPDEYTLIKP